MRAMVLRAVVGLDDNPAPLELTEVARPVPGPREIVVAVSVCGVCHTELDEIEGRTPPPALPVIPGHEIVGHVATQGSGSTRFQTGDRVGIGWIHSSTGAADENLSKEFRATGRDVDGGYAEFVLVHEDYAYPIPDVFSDAEAAPLLCAGGVGFRSLRLAGLADGEVLGLTGFGGSGHLVLQLARHIYPTCRIFVFARSEEERRFALELGADWAGDTTAPPPQAPHAIIDTTPAWKPVLAALECLRPGGRLVINAIRKEAGDRHLMASIRYEDHLWMEKEIKSVANVTRRDLEEFLPIAARVPLHVELTEYPLEDANQALVDLRRNHVRGAKVLRIAREH
ncbi:MAG: zinc-dependent alcohol dehydrogenase family protein [Gammaproteobacteria bacterium]|nr:zinc-dependent alcohol dehydrogenase family protein [Gammaproteobacteria bacterium]MBT8105782.1 zinc-dependent alcohol dehydrogenase family protein [Gammaproteobacteria bacterium]NNF48984.1 zinc-dependent alcohol dehydrogenase family protein [Woeseiaceae bacterium]NNK25796.1 zinc-dependent alcohol dehydrogenase family protein [Woeseiaceae bacterium]NNL63038.1 zinc-dependent alcohol dehydrogenase family protein [Woeseiaceae bacterium]